MMRGISEAEYAALKKNAARHVIFHDEPARRPARRSKKRRFIGYGLTYGAFGFVVTLGILNWLLGKR